MCKPNCEEKIWFRFEIKGFLMSFKCDLQQGHSGQHSMWSQQRKIDPDGEVKDMVSYHMIWGERLHNLDYTPKGHRGLVLRNSGVG